MEKTTTVTKGDNGWQAKTVIMLPGVIEREGKGLPGEAPAPAFLEIHTSKSYSAPGIRTSAGVYYKTEYGFRTAIGGPTGDYSRGVRSDRNARCTEKKVREFHDESLAFLDQVLADVSNHYGIADLFTAPVTEPA